MRTFFVWFFEREKGGEREGGFRQNLSVFGLSEGFYWHEVLPGWVIRFLHFLEVTRGEVQERGIAAGQVDDLLVLVEELIERTVFFGRLEVLGSD